MCFDDVLAALPQSRKIAPGERRAISINETGHAVVGVRLGVGLLSTVAVPWEAHLANLWGSRISSSKTTRSWLDHIALLLGVCSGVQI